jgi:hypothetical protein
MIVCKIVQTLPRDDVHTQWCSVYSEKATFLSRWTELILHSVDFSLIFSGL